MVAPERHLRQALRSSVPHRWIDQDSDLDDVAARVRAADCVHLDTEFESRREGTTLSVLQLSVNGETVLLDALRLKSLAKLGAAMAAKEWVVHAGRQDVELLIRALGLTEPPPLFDTQIAWALSSADWQVSLPYLEFCVLGVRKAKSFQRDDWMRRPLPPDQIEYAAGDVEHLPQLRTDLLERARKHGRDVDVIHAASRELDWPEPAVEPIGVSLRAFRGAWQLPPRGQAALRYLVARHERGVEHPKPTLFLALARRLPKTARDLARIKGVHRRWADREGEDFVRELARASRAHTDSDFVPMDPEPYATFDEIRLDGWLAYMRAEVSARLCVAPDLAFPRALVARMQARVGETGDRASAEREIAGWRARFVPTWREVAASACASP